MQENLDMQIAKHLGLVYSQLHKFHLVDDQDAESLAYEALYRAIVNYDDSKNIALSTFATVCIYNALGSYVRKLNKQRQIHTISYNNLVGDDDDEFVDFIPAADDVEKSYIHKEVCRLAIVEFKNQYDKLTNEKHKTILRAWYASDFSATTKDIAKDVGVSQSYVSQVINNFKQSLKKKLEDVYYD